MSTAGQFDRALSLYRSVHNRLDPIRGQVVMYDRNDFYVIEANMKYGKEGFRRAGIDYVALMEEMIENEEI